MKTLYLDCGSGISGDMIVAALLDLGGDPSLIEKAVSGLRDECSINISQVEKNGIRACDFDVSYEGCNDHDPEYLHGHGKTEHSSHNERNLDDILGIINKMDISESARSLSEKIFSIVAEAEAKVHGKEISEVHFHEVGAIDSIVDIVSFSVLFDSMGFDNVIIPRIAEGYGTVRCRHGLIPVPVPAVTEISSKYGLPLCNTDVQGELVTPTGAAIAAAVMTSSKLPHGYKIKATGTGAGKREYECPGILRAMEIVSLDSETDEIMKLETNVDDCSGECLGHTMDLLFEAGAKDVCFIPIYMKKNRPAYRLEVLCDIEDTEKMESLIFGNTTTIGIRRSVMERRVLRREIRTVDTPFGTAEVKVCYFDGFEKIYPEYSSVCEICGKSGLSYTEIYSLICGLASKRS